MLQSTATAASVSFIAHNFNFKSFFSQSFEIIFKASNIILTCRFFGADFEITTLVFIIADKSFVCSALQCIEKLHFVITIKMYDTP